MGGHLPSARLAPECVPPFLKKSEANLALFYKLQEKHEQSRGTAQRHAAPEGRRLLDVSTRGAPCASRAPAATPRRWATAAGARCRR